MPNLGLCKIYFEGASHSHNPKIQIPKNVYQGA